MVSENTVWKVRPYGEGIGDYQMISEWWEERDKGRFLETLLSPDGFIIERNGGPVAAVWLYFTAGIGVAFIEFAISKPGQTLQRSSEAFSRLIAFARLLCRERDYGVILGHTVPAVARFLKKEGFQEFPEPLTCVISNTLEQ